MAIAKHHGGVKRFGARYGKRTRERLAKIEVIQKAKHKCPYCNYQAVKRATLGIFECGKCGAKFTGRAYAPMKKKISKAVVEKEVVFEDELFVKKDKTKNEEEIAAEEAKKSIRNLERGTTEEIDEQEEIIREAEKEDSQEENEDSVDAAEEIEEAEEKPKEE